MIKENILLYVCIDGEDSSADTADVVESTEVDTSTEVAQEVEVQEEAPLSEVEIDGEKLTFDQIKQFKNGYNNYSKQVNDFKALQDQSKEATDLFNYIKSNPELAQKLYEFDAELNSNGDLKDKLPSKEREEVSTLRREMTAMKIDSELASIKAKDGSVDEMALLQIATEKGLSLDVAYKVWKADNYDTMLKSKLSEQSKNITKELQNAKATTKTMITEDAGKADDGTFGLSKQEIAMATKMDISVEEYAKWKR